MGAYYADTGTSMATPFVASAMALILEARGKLDPATVTIAAGDSVSMGISATVPANLTTSRIPVYSGYITLNGTNGESLSLPYMGVASSLYDAVIFNSANNLTYVSRYFDIEPVAEGFAFTLPPQNSTEEEKDLYDFPVPVSIDPLGTRVLRLDIVPAVSNSTVNSTEVLGEKIAGSVPGYLAIAQGRGEWYVFWYGELSDYSFAPPGDYYFLFRVLKVIGNQSAAEDYETVKSVTFSIAYNTTTSS